MKNFESRSICEEDLDRLVDGELSEPDRRRLLLAIDEQPGQWRRLALAFLEAQAWRTALHGISPKPAAVASPAVDPIVQPTAPQKSLAASAESRDSSIAWVPFGLAMAASFLIAFFLGRQFYSPGSVPSPGAISTTNTQVAASKPAVSIPIASHPSVPVVEAARKTSPVSDEIRTIHAPIVDAAKFGRGPWSNQPNALHDLAQDLQNVERKIEHQRRFAPVELDGGWQMVFPVDEVEITPVARTVY